MKTKNIFLIVLMIAPQFAEAYRFQKYSECKSEVESFVREKYDSGELNPKKSIDWSSDKRHDIQCNIKTRALDGISFYVVNVKNEKGTYIKIHNGLDGSYSFYGPFNK